ncbi:MAG: ATP-binding protein [Actinomycetota bacterium]|nr:ATP-binding protein [Actinomycetota bacterium]
MPRLPTSEDRRDLRVRLVAEPVSVPGARRFVRDGLREWGRDELLDDAELCMTELAANAALHSGSRFMDVHLHDLGDAVELAVLDEGAVAQLESVVPRTSPAMRSGSAVLVSEPTTGRGLAIVSMLSHDWGVVDAHGRRRIWAVLAPDDAIGPVRPPRTDQAVAEAGPNDVLPEGWKLVRVPDAPVALSVRIDSHIDEVIRELQLIDSSPTSPTAEQARLINGLVSVPFARHTARAQALDAAERGQTHMDVYLPMPREAAPSVRGLLVAMRVADQLCRDHQLLAVPASEEMDLLREWFTHSIVTQLEDDADPLPYDDWLAARDG